MKDILIIVVAMISLIGILVAAAALCDRASCYSKWERSGMQADWGLVTGCVVSADGKTFIPESAYRDVKAHK